MLSILLFFFVGAIFRYPLNKKSFRLTITNVFINLLAGLIITITLYSVLLTHFRTVNSFFILLSVLLLIFYKRRQLNDIRIENETVEFSWGKIILWLLFISVIFYGFFALQIVNIFDGSFSNQTINYDFYYYAKTSQYLSLGYENSLFANNLILDASKIQPYHYFELWVTSFLTSVFDVPPLISFTLLTTTILAIILYFGILSLYKNQNQLTISIFLFVLFLFFLSFGYSRILIKTFPSIRNLFLDLRLVGITNTPKFFPTSILFVSFLLFQKRNDTFSALLSILCLPVVSSINTPPVFGGLLVLFIYCSIKHIKSYFNTRNIIIALSFVALYTFYLLITADPSAVGIDINNFDYQLFFDNSKWQLFRFCVSYSPFFLLLVFINFKTRDYLFGKEDLLLFLAILLSALLMAGISYNSFNAGQFFSNIAVPLTNIIVIYFLLNFDYKKINLFAKVCIALLIITCFITSFMGRIAKTRDDLKQYKEAVINELERVEPGLRDKRIFLGYIQSKEFYQDKTPYQWGATSDLDGADLGSFVLMYKNTLMISISDLTAFDVFNTGFSGKIRDYCLKGISKGAFYRFVLRQKNEKKFETEEQSQLDFINKMKIKYLFIAENAKISSEFKSHLSLICADSKSGELFYKVIN